MIPLATRTRRVHGMTDVQQIRAKSNLAYRAFCGKLTSENQHGGNRGAPDMIDRTRRLVQVP